MANQISLHKIFGLFERNWKELLKSPKMFAILISITWLIANMVLPYMDVAKETGEVYNLLEPYLLMFNVVRAMIIIPISYLLWICDYPKAGNEHMYSITRMGKKNWLLGQILFMLSAGFLYLFLLFVISCLICQKNAFLFNGYSGFMQRLSSDYASMNEINGVGIAVKDTLYCHFRPYLAVASNVGMMLLYMLWSSLIQIIFVLQHKKAFGVIINISLIGIGYVTSFFRWNIQWIFPYGNIMLGSHFKYAFSEEIVPLWYSVTYFITGAILLYIVARKCLKEYSFFGLGE